MLEHMTTEKSKIKYVNAAIYTELYLVLYDLSVKKLEKQTDPRIAQQHLSDISTTLES